MTFGNTFLEAKSIISQNHLFDLINNVIYKLSRSYNIIYDLKNSQKSQFNNEVPEYRTGHQINCKKSTNAPTFEFGALSVTHTYNTIPLCIDCERKRGKRTIRNYIGKTVHKASATRC